LLFGLFAAFLLRYRAICAAASPYSNLELVMASITKRGDFQFQVIIRRKG
jgi:hypothetical protein